jgi:hypothetical protein
MIRHDDNNGTLPYTSVVTIRLRTSAITVLGRGPSTGPQFTSSTTLLRIGGDAAEDASRFSERIMPKKSATNINCKIIAL